MFNRINAVVLFVHDFQKCLSFYRDIVGLEVVQLESRFAAFKMHDQDFALVEMSEAVEMVKIPLEAFTPLNRGTNRVMLCARVEDVDTVYATLTTRGVEFTGAPTDQPWGIRTIYFKDPEGNIWEFAHSIQS